MIKKSSQRVMTAIMLIVFLLATFSIGPPLLPQALAWSDAGLSHCGIGKLVNLWPFRENQLYNCGTIEVKIKGAINGSGQAALLNTSSDKAGYGYVFIASDDYSSAAREMNGEPSFVNSNVDETRIFWNSGANQEYRAYIRDFAELCGAEASFDGNKVNVQTTEKPKAKISPPSTVKARQPVRIGISGTSFVPSSSSYKNISWKLTVDGARAGSGSGRLAFSKQVSYTFDDPGRYTLHLEVTDGVERIGEDTETVTVRAGATPPRPPVGGNTPPVADFDLPSSAEVGESVTVTDKSEDYDGYIVSHSWDVSPSTYSGSLSGMGGTLTFSAEDAYDVTLTVTDDDGDTDTKTKTIRVGPAPPPPPPPLPENDPPVARFSMPSKCGQGETVNVTNKSYDPDGTIVDVDWDVSPSSGVTDTLDDNGGTITFSQTGEYTVEVTVTDDFGDSDSYDKDIEVVNEPPEAKIVVPDKVVQGDDVTIRSASEDDDGEIAKLTWTVTPAEGVVGTLDGESSTVYFDKEGAYTITLTVEDNWGATDTDTVTVNVEPAIPQAFFTDTGAYKQNRKIGLTEQGQSSTRYPIIKDQNEWEIVPAGGSATTDAIRVKTVAPDNKEVLFKAPGTYKVRLRVTNTAGHTSEWYERAFEIQRDEPPTADFVVQTAYLRDVNDAKKATVSPRDTSYSPDGDVIAHRTWKYRYDSDNDGDFSDEAWVVISDTNELAPSWQTDQVGKYQVELEVTEGFGEDTIPEFVAPGDYLKADTSAKALEEKRAEVINVRPAVAFQVLKKKKADVIFTVGDTSSGTQDFDANIVRDLNGLVDHYLEPELRAKQVSAAIQTVETSTVSTSDAGAAEIFNNWQKYPLNSSSKFNAGWRLSGNEIYTTANVHWTGYWDNRKQYVTDQIIEFEVMTTGHGDPWGFTFRMTSPEFDRYSFYALEWGPHWQELTLAKITNWKPSDNDYTHGGPLYHGTISAADGYYGPTYHGGYAGALNECCGEVLVQVPFNVQFGRWDKTRIDVNNNHIQIWVNNTKVIDYVDSDNPLLVGSYGPYTASQYNTHFRNVTITTGTRKTLDEVLKDSSLWREDAQHFLVNIGAAPYPEFSDAEKSGYIYSRLLNDRIDFSVLGSAVNRSQMLDVIARNDGQGTFILNTNRSATMQQLTDYIIAKLEAAYGPVENYVLLNEEVYYKTHYEDFETDPKMAERWQYTHNPAYFENSLGTVPFNRQWLESPVYRFDKTGELVTTFQARDNPKNDVRFDEYRLWSYMPADSMHLYVHRRPVAMFGTQLNKSGSYYNVIINSDAFDLDHISRLDKGITEHRWSWRVATSPTWNAGKPTTLSPNQDYLIRYEVKDLEGVWSYPEVKLVTTRNVNLAPVAQFSVKPNPVVCNKSVTTTDLSYDPNGTPIAQKQWRVKPPNGAWGSQTGSPPTSFGVVGEWSVELKVSDGSLWSEPFYQTVQVIPDNTAPVARFTVYPNPVYEDQNVTYTDNSYDPDGDRIVAKQWRVRKNGGIWQTYTNPPTRFDAVGGAGVYDIELRVQDQPSLPQLNAKWSNWYRRTLAVLDSFDVRGSIIPVPAERGRRIRVTAEAFRSSDGQLVQIEQMKIIIPHATRPNGSVALPAGKSPHIATMTFNPATRKYTYEYLVPERTAQGFWPDDGTYYVKIIGYKGSTKKEELLEIEVKGHILRRVIIRTVE